MLIYLGVTLAAFATGWLFAKYIKAVSQNKAGKAAIADFGIMLMGSITTQAWFVSHNDFGVFLLFDIVAAIATYIAVKHGGKNAL